MDGWVDGFVICSFGNFGGGFYEEEEENDVHGRLGCRFVPNANAHGSLEELFGIWMRCVCIHVCLAVWGLWSLMHMCV